MTIAKKFSSPGVMFAAILAACAFALFFPTSPAHAQGIITDISNSIWGTPQDTKAVYDRNYAMLEGLGCWGCDVFDAFAGSVFTAGKTVATQGADKLVSVIVAVASLFSLVYIGSSFVSGDASDLLQRWKVFWRLMIAVTIGSAWLTVGNAFDNTWNAVYTPLLKIPMAVADSVPAGSAPTTGTGCGSGGAPANAPGGAGEVVSDMRGVVCGGHLITIKGIAFGLAIANTGEGLMGSLINLVVGLLIVVIFTWVAISFPLRFIEVLLRLTVVGVVTPVLVVCAVFKQTRGYIAVGISNVLNAGCLFAFTAIMFKLGGSFFFEKVNARIASVDAANTDWQTQASQSIVLVGAGVIFAAMLKMAPVLASEFSQFRGQSGGVNDAATSFSSSVVTLPVKAAAAGVALKTGGAIAGKMGASAGNAAGGQVAQALGKKVSDGS